MFENSLIVVNIKLDNARWFLRGLNKPFDPFAQKAMHDTMIGIANCTEAVWAYHIGNEIVLYLNPNAISRCKTMLSGMTRDNLTSITGGSWKSWTNALILRKSGLILSLIHI